MKWYAQEVVSSPSLEIFNRRLDAHLTRKLQSESNCLDELQNILALPDSSRNQTYTGVFASIFAVSYEKVFLHLLPPSPRMLDKQGLVWPPSLHLNP